jgi:hypothetical protein
MFRRYDITDERDLQEAMQRTLDYVNTLPKERNVVNFERRTGTEPAQGAKTECSSKQKPNPPKKTGTVGHFSGGGSDEPNS